MRRRARHAHLDAARGPTADPGVTAHSGHLDRVFPFATKFEPSRPFNTEGLAAPYSFAEQCVKNYISGSRLDPGN